MKTWMCTNCGWIYDEAEGDVDSGLAPGTRWTDVPKGWTCPDCGSSKADFEMVEYVRPSRASSAFRKRQLRGVARP